MKRNSYCKDINGFELYEGDTVLYVVKRCSPNHGSWGQIRTKGDGYYKIHGTICFEGAKFVIRGNKEEMEKLSLPIGKEQFERQVWFEVNDLGEYIAWGEGSHKFGVEKGGYIEKVGIEKQQKNKKVNDRLHALGIA